VDTKTAVADPSHPRQAGGADNCSKAHAAVQDAVPHRALVEIITGHNREQGPNGAHEEGKDQRAHEGGLKHRSIADIANARAHGPVYAFRRQCALEQRIALPAIQNQDYAYKGKGIKQKH
jgi:hypothetical protein